MKRICFLVDSLFTVGGVQRVTAVIAKALSVDYDVTIVTFDHPSLQDTTMYDLADSRIAYRFFSYPPTPWLRSRMCKAYSAFYRYLQSHGQSTPPSPSFLQRTASNAYSHSSFPRPLRNALVNELLQGHYDTIIGVHAPIAARLATLKPRLRGARCIGWIHNSFEALFGETSLYIGPQLKQHYLFQLKKLDSTVVLCHYDAKEYMQQMPGLMPTVIYNPLTLIPGKPSEGTSKRFLAVGRMSYLHKGFDLLIEAFRIFAQQNDDWTLDIVGEGPEEKTLRKQITNNRLEHRISIHPFTNNIQHYYSKAQVYVLSSRWEGFGLVLVEAMAHGLPVVSSDLPTSKEIMGDNALYFENGNVEQLAQRLADATTIDWTAMSAKARETAQGFDTQTITSQWKEIL